MILPGFPDAAPLAGLGGGILIGIAAALMLLGAGRIAGVSGISARAFGISNSGISRDGAWAFLIGLPLGAAIIGLLGGGGDPQYAGTVPLVVAGVLVGLGTRMGSGCTSGHGVCGVSRFSQRSLIATATFIVTGMVTVAVMNALGLEILP